MKALFVAAEYPPVRGGVSTYTANLARAAGRSHCDVLVITCGGTPGTSVEAAGVTVTRGSRLLARRFVKMMPLAALAVRAARSWQPDVAICCRLSHEAVPALLARRASGVPVVLVVHGSEVLQYERSAVARAVVRRLLRAVDAVIVNSRYTQRLVCTLGADAERVHVVWPPIEPSDYTARPHGSILARYGLSERRFVLTVGQLTPRKGHARVMRALAALGPEQADVAYVVAGEGPARAALQRLAWQLGIAARVVFAGFVTAAERNELYEACTVYVMPTSVVGGDVEGFGIAYLEAGVFGKPVIGGEGGGTNDAVAHGESGLLIGECDDEGLRRALARLLGDEVLRRRMGESGRARATARFSIAAAAGPLRAALEQAVARREARQHNARLFPDVAKRAFDVLVSSLLLAALGPAMVVIAGLIRLREGAPVLHRGERVGVYGRRFTMLKFRTMVVDAETRGGTSTPSDDPRITRFGTFLRANKLDELPQLLNVLRGEMSLVGPRPQAPWAVDLYSGEERALLSVRPGITDLASIRFRDEAELLKGSANPDLDYLEKIAPAKIRLGLDYVRRRSLLLDARILAATAWSLAGGEPERVLGRYR